MKIYCQSCKSIVGNIQLTHLKCAYHIFMEGPSHCFLTNHFTSSLPYSSLSTWVGIEGRIYKNLLKNLFPILIPFNTYVYKVCVKKPIRTENHGTLCKKLIPKYEYIIKIYTHHYVFNFFLSKRPD